MAARSDLRRWRWVAFLLGTLGVSFGCTPATLSLLFLPFTDDRIPPKCHLAKNKEVTLCITTSSTALETRPDLIPAEQELAELLAQQLRQAAVENKEKIKVVPPSRVRSFLQSGEASGRALSDVGKQFKADYVISLEIASMSLYERGSQQMLFRGNTEIKVSVIDVAKPAGEGTIFTETYRREFPLNHPLEVTDARDVPLFRQRFLGAVATDIARMFTPYPSNRRHLME
ncbi:MAG: hypothetical protein NZO58_00745 [Gemmataceae bacterium]|nr:hypothetical protein [Gemmataceae bacterium]